MKRDILIGYITLAVLISAFCVFAFSIFWEGKGNSRQTVLVQFSEMGALQKEDIVVVRGFAIGKISSISQSKKGKKALVKIALDEPWRFRKDTKFINVSPNIMGSRCINVVLGKDEEIAPENYVFDGFFELGFAEVLQLADFAREQVALLMEFIRVLHSGDEKNSSLQKKFEDILDECENLILSVDGIIATTEREAMSAVGKVGIYSAQIADASDKVSHILDSLMVQAARGIISIDKVVENVQASIENLNRILTEFENNPVTVALMDEREIINGIDSLVAGLQTLLNSVDRQGLVLYDEDGKRKSMVSLGNIHLIRETARSKAKKRAAEN